MKFRTAIECCFLMLSFSAMGFAEDTAFIASAGDCKSPAVANEGNSVFMAWLATEGRPVNLYFRKSGDEGKTWNSAQMISKENGYCLPPSIAVNAGVVHLAWIDCGEVINGELYYTRSLDGGGTWEKSSIIIGDINSAQFPQIATEGNNVFLIWQDVETKVYFKASYDKGQTWEKEILLGEVGKHSCYCFPPALTVNGNEVVVVWNDIDEDKGCNVRIFGHSLLSDKEHKVSSIVNRKSLDNGRTWGKEHIMTSTRISKEMKDEIENPTMFSNGSRSYLFWLDKHNLPLGEIFYVGYNPVKEDGAITKKRKPLFSTPKRSPKCPSVVFDNDKNLHVTWTTFFNSESIVHYGEIDSTGKILKEKRDLTATVGPYHNPTILRTPSGLLHIFWFTKPKDKKVPARIFLKTSKDDGLTWEYRGSQAGE